MANWFYGKDSAQHGPISDLEIRNLIATGQIEGTTMIWREGMAEWLPLSNVPELQSTGTTQPIQPPHPHHATLAPTSGLAIASLICGICATLFSCLYIGFIFGIPAAICGHLSIKKIKHSNSPIQGKGMAIAGIITGYLSIFISLAMIGFLAFAIFHGQQTQF